MRSTREIFQRAKERKENQLNNNFILLANCNNTLTENSENEFKNFPPLKMDNENEQKENLNKQLTDEDLVKIVKTCAQDLKSSSLLNVDRYELGKMISLYNKDFQYVESSSRPYMVELRKYLKVKQENSNTEICEIDKMLDFYDFKKHDEVPFNQESQMMQRNENEWKENLNGQLTDENLEKMVKACVPSQSIELNSNPSIVAKELLQVEQKGCSNKNIYDMISNKVQGPNDFQNSDESLNQELKEDQSPVNNNIGLQPQPVPQPFPQQQQLQQPQQFASQPKLANVPGTTFCPPQPTTYLPPTPATGKPYINL